VNRILKFAATRFGATIPPGGSRGPREEELVADLSSHLSALEAHLEGLEFRKAAQELRAMWTSGNVYLNDTAPWKTLTDDWERTATVVRQTINLVRLFAVISDPFLPQTTRRIADALALTPEELRWPTRPVVEELAIMRPERRVGVPDLLFRRIEDEEVEAWSRRFGGDATAAMET
jgi:methionyl-tRNA synthetase